MTKTHRCVRLGVLFNLIPNMLTLLYIIFPILLCPLSYESILHLFCR